MTAFLTNAPAIVTQLATQLADCAAWTGNIYYPRVTWATVVLPAAVIEETERNVQNYAAGAAGLSTGSLKITLHYGQTSDDGTVETAGRTILDQLFAQTSGIIFRTSDCSLSGTYSSAEAATDTGTISIQLSLSYGLSI